MFKDIPEETLALLRAIHNQPHHTMSLAQICCLDISGISDRQKWLSENRLIEYCDYGSSTICGISSISPSSVKVTTAGCDLLKEECKMEEELSAALLKIRQLEEKASYWESKATSIEKSCGVRTALWSLFVGIVSAAVSAWLS